MMIDGVEIPTEPGAMLRLDCGDTTLVPGRFVVGDDFVCTEDDCGEATTIAGIVEIDLIDIVHN
jgi:hypothetical protein